MRGGELGLVRVSNKCQMQSMPFRAGFACWPVFIDKILWTTTIKKTPAELPGSAESGDEKVPGALDHWLLTPAQRTFIESLIEDDDRTDD
ncbi:hypothetical protein JNO12_16870 [Erwinia aphidicola]|nr:hypothetical protein [Erwinia aphidicola]